MATGRDRVGGLKSHYSVFRLIISSTLGGYLGIQLPVRFGSDTQIVARIRYNIPITLLHSAGAFSLFHPGYSDVPRPLYSQPHHGIAYADPPQVQTSVLRLREPFGPFAAASDSPLSPIRGSSTEQDR
jgi:hypothetical protein